MIPATPTGSRALGINDAHVWFARLEVDPAILQDWRGLLSADEQARAGRFLRAEDANRFVAARATLRLVLSTYVGTAPGDLRFAYSPFGKPELAGAGATDLRFNLSHSGDLGLVGVTRGRKIGVDVEMVRPATVTDDLARTIMATAEFQTFSSLPTGQRVAAFFNCWTRKEALLKARGDGLSCPLQEVEVSFVPGAQPRLVRAPGESNPSEDWSITCFSPGDDYAAAIAVEGHGLHIENRLFNLQAPGRGR